MRCSICNEILDDSAVDDLCYECWVSTAYEDIEYFIDDDGVEPE